MRYHGYFQFVSVCGAKRDGGGGSTAALMSDVASNDDWRVEYGVAAAIGYTNTHIYTHTEQTHLKICGK